MSSVLEVGFLESAQRLLSVSGREWSQHELLTAAERAVLRNTGWPIGLVLTKPGLAPRATPEGIEARITSEDRLVGGGEDFWSFLKDGSYYVSRAFEEDFYSGRGAEQSPESFKRFIFFDVRIWRIAEVLLHSAALFREIGIRPDEPYLVAVNHLSLEGREFRTSDPRRLVLYDRHCEYPTVSWSKEVTQDYVTANLHALVSEVANGLFVLFDFADIDADVMRQIVDEFLSRSV